MEKFRFKSEYENMPNTGNWINMYERKKTKKKSVNNIFLVYLGLSSITRPSAFLLQETFYGLTHSESHKLFGSRKRSRNC